MSDPIKPHSPKRERREAPEGLSERAEGLWAHSISEWGADRAITLIGQSEQFVTAVGKLEKFARFNEPVLLYGESGVGKELFAKAIYLMSPRRGKPFVAVNCPQYQDGNLTVSELFGHKKGSFTGATSDRKGCFETANGGVIFLDEINHLHMSAQLMLLRALGYGEFQPLGSDATRKVNVRVIAASQRPLQRQVVQKHFRNDLFFRLRYFVLTVPPLRERGDDWHLIAEHFLGALARRYGVRKMLSPASVRLLRGYPWPGNIRELVSVVTMGYAMSDRDRIEPEDFVSMLGDEAQEHAESDPYRNMVIRGADFWDAVREPFLERDLNRSQVRTVVRRGLEESGFSYSRLLERFNLPAEEYQRFMDFLRHHRLKP
jgi:DNA-binding NtrC family response regulator